MRKMDGRDSAECQNWEKRDITGIKWICLNKLNDKKGIVLSLTNQKGGKNVKGKNREKMQ